MPVSPNADTIPYLSTRWCASGKTLKIERAQGPNSLMTADVVLHPTLWAPGSVKLAESQRPAVLNLAHVCTFVSILPSTPPHYMPRTQLGLRPRMPDVCAVMARPGSSHGPHGAIPQSFACAHLLRHATTSPQPEVLLHCLPIHDETGNFVNR